MDLKYSLSNDVLTIENSAKMICTKEMRKRLVSIREKEADKDYDIFKRSNSNMINEWCTHNICYMLGILKDRAVSVDFEYPQKWYLKVIYALVGIPYRIFH
jgi:hypothetical protein